MLKHHLAACLMATALCAAPALAQTNQTPANPPPAGQNNTVDMKPTAPATNAPAGQNTTVTTQPASPAGGSMAPNMATQSATAPVQGGNIQYITQNRPDMWRASKLEGVNVYNEQNEKVGDIREVLVNKQGQVEAVVIGVGGFLGIGERDVAVPYNALQWVQEADRTAANTTGAAGPDGNRVTGTAGGGMTGAPGVGGTTATAPAGAPGAPGNTNMAGTGTAGTTTAGADTTQPATTGAVSADNDMAASRGDQMRDYPERAILAGATKDQLKEAPEFKYSR